MDETLEEKARKLVDLYRRSSLKKAAKEMRMGYVEARNLMISYLGYEGYEDLIKSHGQCRKQSVMYTRDQAKEIWNMYMGYTSGNWRKEDVMEISEIAERMGVREAYVRLAIREVSQEKMTSACIRASKRK